ncbi:MULTISPECIES: hypothetical protein [Rhodoplanes]|uniref:hypothetical protein n=1 Tax=Rhodoplanes TaxID=29407 RepID=UPI00101C0F34|nr:hypothetical protein [Rhodoplanes serenus]
MIAMVSIIAPPIVRAFIASLLLHVLADETEHTMGAPAAHRLGFAFRGAIRQGARPRSERLARRPIDARPSGTATLHPSSALAPGRTIPRPMRYNGSAFPAPAPAGLAGGQVAAARSTPPRSASS